MGQCIARFHRAGVFHADLNAHNVQIDAANRIFLLDFDRGRIRGRRAAAGGEANLARLHRSLTKISRRSGGRVAFSGTGVALAPGRLRVASPGNSGDLVGVG